MSAALTLLIYLSMLPDADAKNLIERKVQQLGQAAEDIVTLGEAGRRRDQVRARHQRETEELRLQEMQRLEQLKIEQLELQITNLKNTIQLLDYNIDCFTMLKGTLETNVATTGLLAKSFTARSMEFAALREIVDIQQRDLQAWSLKIKKAHHDIVDMAGQPVDEPAPLSRKVDRYIEQIRNLPMASAEIHDDSVIDEAVASGLEAYKMLENNLNRLQSGAERELSRLSSLEIILKNLKNKNPAEKN